MRKLIVKICVQIVLLIAILIIGYITINLIVYNRIIIPIDRIENAAIIKKALHYKDLKDKKYIICKYERVTGYNYELINENGKRVHKYCRVKGVELGSELCYDFLISGNDFIFYVVEKKQYYDEELGEEVTEYIVDGWDILYPVNHDTLINFTPKYVIKNDLKN